MKEKTSLVFTGDIGFDKYMDGQWDNPDLISKDILSFLHSADHVVVNVEGPVADCSGDQNQTGTAQLLHSMNPAATKLLRNIGADVWNICNNHIMDAGEYGIESTLKQAQQNNAKTIGAGMNIEEARTPLILREAGGIGMFGVGYQRACRAAGENKAGCYSWSDLHAIKITISEIKKTCRWCIVVAHAGEEFTPLPSPYTRDRYLEYLDMGADLVIAHHPHVPMNYEFMGEKAIFYSLGNFIFDTDYQRSQFNTQYGVLLKLYFTENDYSFEAAGLEILRDTPRIVSAPLPRIFTKVEEKDYNLLAPLSAKVLIEATKRQQKYLNPTVFQNATKETWDEHFSNPMRTGRVPGETLDFFILRPLAEKAEEGEWKKSEMTEVKRYMLEHLDE